MPNDSFILRLLYRYRVAASIDQKGKAYHEGIIAHGLPAPSYRHFIQTYVTKYQNMKKKAKEKRLTMVGQVEEPRRKTRNRKRLHGPQKLNFRWVRCCPTQGVCVVAASAGRAPRHCQPPLLPAPCYKRESSGRWVNTDGKKE